MRETAKTPSTTVGIDIGSTTVKLIVVKNRRVVYQQYERHMSQVRPKTLELLRLAGDLLRQEPFTVALSGSAGWGWPRPPACRLSRRCSPPARW